jgi:uncharacterized protein YqeY
MRNKDALRRDTLSGLRAAIKTAEINARSGEGDVSLDDAGRKPSSSAKRKSAATPLMSTPKPIARTWPTKKRPN